MLFFDDERRNSETERLGMPLSPPFPPYPPSRNSHRLYSNWIFVILIGVTFQLVPHGTNEHVFEKGLAEWRKRHPVQVAEEI